MGLGLMPTAGNSVLAKLVADGYVWIKLHVGDPGAAGTSNPAVETTRKQATWTTPATAGATADMSNTGALSWTTVAGTEDYTHFTAWTASTAGTCGFSGLVTADAVTAGNTFTVPVGGLHSTFPLAS